MADMKKYECPDCGAVEEVEEGADVPECIDCGITMKPVAEAEEESGEFEEEDFGEEE